MAREAASAAKAGGSHSLALTKEGAVFSFGRRCVALFDKDSLLDVDQGLLESAQRRAIDMMV